MRIPAERLTTADQAYSPLAEVRTKGGGRARPVLIVLLALLYPWHFAVWATSYTGKNPTIPHGGLNLSLGDSMIALIGVVLLLQLAGGRVRLPRYALQTFVWFTVAAVSVTVSALSPAFFFELHDSEVGLVKILAAATWMIAVFWLLEDSFPQRFLLLGGSSVLAATGFAVASVIENVFLGIERPFGPFQNANIYGNYLMLNVFLAIGIDRLLGQPAGRVAVRPAVRRALRLAIRFGAVTILILGLLATGSRGAMVGFGIGLLLAVPWGAVKRLSLRGTVAFAVGALVLALALSWYLGRNPYVVTRWSQTAAGQGPNGGAPALSARDGDSPDLSGYCGGAGSSGLVGLVVAAAVGHSRQLARQGQGVRRRRSRVLRLRGRRVHTRLIQQRAARAVPLDRIRDGRRPDSLPSDQPSGPSERTCGEGAPLTQRRRGKVHRPPSVISGQQPTQQIRDYGCACAQ